MYNFPHYLEKIKWELNSLLGFKICIGFLRIVIIGRLFQCCSLARIGSGFFLGFFLCVCERLKTHLSCYHWKHVFLLIHTGVPVSVIYWNAVSAFGMSGIKHICYCFPGAVASVLGFQRSSQACFPWRWEDFPVVEGRKNNNNQEPVLKAEFLHGGNLQLLTNSVQKCPHLQCCVSSGTLLTLWQLCHPRRSVLSHPAEKKRWGKGARLCQSCLCWGIGRPLTICISMLASSLPVSRS